MQEYIKKILGSDRRHSSSSASHNAMLTISNDEMKDIIRMVKSLDNSGLLLKGVTEMLLGTLGNNIIY